MTNPLKKLPRSVLANVRDFASDRVQPQPTAALIRNLTFTDRFHSGYDNTGLWRAAGLVVSGDALSHRTRKCFDRQCWVCMIPDCSCHNAAWRTMPTGSREYVYSDFNGHGGWSHFSMWPGEHGA